MEVDKGTKFTLSIETAISVGVSIFMVVGLWFNLQADIEEAKAEHNYWLFSVKEFKIFEMPIGALVTERRPDRTN